MKPALRAAALLGVVAALSAGALVARSPAPDSDAGPTGSTGSAAPAADLVADSVLVYKSPTCGCCGGWVDHMRANGFHVTVRDTVDVAPIKQRLGVPAQMVSCHTSVVNGYVIEGHVPAATVRKLLQEKPALIGIAAPGMPRGSPGMEGPVKDRYDVVTFDRSGHSRVYTSH